MNLVNAAPGVRRTETKILVPFLVIAFGLTWGLAALLFVAYDTVVAIFGEVSMSNPLFILAVYAPLIASTVMIIHTFGFSRLGAFFRRATLARTSPWWWAFIILGIPLAMFAGALVKGTWNSPFPFSPWYLVFPALLQALLLGPVEEFGWCGIALPIMQRKYSPFVAGLLHGVIWMTWHIPAFLIGGTPQSAWDFLPFAVGGIACSLIITALFNASRGSILLPALVHFQLNNPIWPDAQPWDNLFILLCAILVVWLNRRRMFQRGNSITNLLMPDDDEFSRQTPHP
jgi:membrane protease YdiL (CAAX protease family)